MAASSTLNDADLFRRLILRTHRYSKLLQLAPKDSWVIRDEEALLREVQEAMTARNIDWKAWLESPEGQTALLLHEDNEKSKLFATERCGKCSHNHFDGDEYQCKKKIEMRPTHCSAFDDTEEIFEIRLQTYAIDRCSTCKKCVSVPLKIIEGNDYKCSIKANMLAKNCNFFESNDSFKLRDIPEFKFEGVQQTKESTELLIGMVLAKKSNPSIDKPLEEEETLSNAFGAQILLKRIKAYKLPYIVTSTFYVMSVKTFVNTPGDIMTLLWLCHQYHKRTKKTLLGLEEWVDIFPFGTPSDSDKSAWWDSQKLTSDERNVVGSSSDNLVDYSHLWSL